MNNNIKPYIWGPNVWYTIFSFTASYPDKPNNDNINSIKLFFTSLNNLLPCISCRSSYNEYIYEKDTDINNNINFESKNNLIEFVFKIREKVNKKQDIYYGITIDYFKKKLDYMLCKDDNKIDFIVNNLNEMPIFTKESKSKIINYLHKHTNFNTKYTKNILHIIHKFISNPEFDIQNKYFKLFYKRNLKCKEIINKIHYNMSINDYDLKTSFVKDIGLHQKLFYLACSIIPNNQLDKLLS